MTKGYKKLVVKLFAAALLACIPTCIMAQSNNSFTKNILTEAKGYQFSIDNASRLKIDLKDPIEYKGSPIYFYVNLNGAKWLDSINTSTPPLYFPGAAFKKISDTQLEVKITNSLNRSIYYIPLLVQLNGGNAEVSIDGGQTEISSMKETIFAMTSEQKAAISVGEVPGVREEGYVADIKIEEIIKGSLVNSEKEDDRTITLTLLNANYEFDNDKLAIEPVRGFDDMAGIYSRYKMFGNKEDKSVIEIILPQRKEITAAGKLNISEIKVKTKTKDIHPGQIDIGISGTNVQESVVKAADIKDYSLAVFNKLKSVIEIKAGSKNLISFSVKENVKGTMVPGRTVEIMLDKGCLAPEKKAMVSDLSIGSILLNKQDITKFLTIHAILKDGFIVGFNFDVPKTIKQDEINEIQFKDMALYVSRGIQGDVKISANVVGEKGKDNMGAVVATIKPQSTVKVEPLRIKAGFKDQTGGKIIIAETDKDMIQPGMVELEIEEQDGVIFSKEPTVTVIAGDILIGDVRYDGVKPNMLKIEILRASRNASSIEIKNYCVTADGGVPDGGYKLTVKGNAIAPDSTLGEITVDNFMIIGKTSVDTPSNTDSTKTVSKFSVGSETYDVNGQSKSMDAKAYAEAGRTMVPLRYVADAVGISGKDITFGNNVITIKTLQKTIVLFNGANRILVNNQEMTIDGSVVTKAGRTYIPIAEIAKLLDVKVSWDAQTKTAVFEK